MSLIATDQLKVIIGMGVTGMSYAKLLSVKKQQFIMMDTREKPAKLAEFQALYPAVTVMLGDLDKDVLASASEIIISPGIAKNHPAIDFAVSQGVALIGDVDLFCREVTKPIIAITGSNAKSTVTTLVGDMARESGLNVGVGGNIGFPVLDFLEQEEKDIYVLELSSFQLETTNDLRASVATVLNVSPDHLDRYDNKLQQYYQAKHRIFRGCKAVVENLDDALTQPLLPKNVDVVGYRLGESDFNIFGLLDVNIDGVMVEHLALAKKPLLATKHIKLPGKHNVINALSALAIGHVAGFKIEAMLSAITNFEGLEHRCQLVAEKHKVRFFDDSKGTNVGATIAALNGLGSVLKNDEKIILIAGGVGKGADFSELAIAANQYVKKLVLIGEDALKIADSLPLLDSYFAKDMQDAVKHSAKFAKEGDIVLLSPACASFDMFNNFNHRGEVFSLHAKEL